MSEASVARNASQTAFMNFDRLADLRSLEAERERQLARLIRRRGRPPGLMYSRKIRSGVSSATFSISTPPSWLTISTGFSVERSSTMPEIELAGDRQPLLDQHPADASVRADRSDG